MTTTDPAADYLADVLQRVITTAEAAPPAALADAYRAVLAEAIGAVSAARDDAAYWRARADDAERERANAHTNTKRRADEAAAVADYKRRHADAAAIRCAAGAITVGLGDGDAVDVFRRVHALADAIERGPGGAP